MTGDTISAYFYYDLPLGSIRLARGWNIVAGSHGLASGGRAYTVVNGTNIGTRFARPAPICGYLTLNRQSTGLFAQMLNPSLFRSANGPGYERLP